MKRMNEVFDLPLHVYNIDYGQSVFNSTKQEDLHAAHAINHVDALADALDNLINASEGSSAWYKKEHKEAVLALAAYRGSHD